MSGSKAMRLALREEGLFWNAYCAPIGSMDGAVLLGSIRLVAVWTNPALKDGFMDLMRMMVAEMLREQGIPVMRWDEPVEAPDSERGQG